MTDIAFIGLGNMGLPMARNLEAAGHDVLGFDLSDARLEAARDVGLGTAATLARTVRERAVVITMLPAGEHVRDAYAGAEGILRYAKPHALLIDCSTIDVATAREMAAEASERGHAMLDAPVSGGVSGAERATLIFMVGGEEEAFDCAQPLLEAMGRRSVYCGGSGNGQAAKICNNMMLGIQMLSVCEAFALGERLGIDPQKLFDVSANASGQCWSLTTYCPVPGLVETAPSNNGYRPGFTTEMMLKDLKLAQDACRLHNISTPMGAKAAHMFEKFALEGSAGLDFSAIIDLIAR